MDVKVKPDLNLLGEEYYNVNSLAEILSISPGACRRNFRLGKFPKFKHQGKYYLSKSNIEKYVAMKKLRALEDKEFLKILGEVIDEKIKEEIEKKYLPVIVNRVMEKSMKMTLERIKEDYILTKRI